MRHQLRHHFMAYVGLLAGLGLTAEVDVVLGEGMCSGQFIGARDVSCHRPFFADVSGIKIS